MDHAGFFGSDESRVLRGRLAPVVLERLAALPVERADVRAFVERAFHLIRQAGLRRPMSHRFRVNSSVADRAPAAGHLGRPGSPITGRGPHRRFDDLVQRLCGDKGRMLDIACGFPPFTSVDSASALPGWTSSASIARCRSFFSRMDWGTMRRSTPTERCSISSRSRADQGKLEALLVDYDGSKRSLEELFRQLRAGGAVSRASLRQHPVTWYERDNLTFVRADLDACPLNLRTRFAASTC
jgi:hypothetical protein